MKQSQLDPRIIEWVINHVDRNAKVTSIHRLKGSTSSTLHHVSLTCEGYITDLVVRQFDNKEWLHEEPDLVKHEAESLRLAAGAYLSTPDIIAFDEEGDVCGVPLVLMTMLVGNVELKPTNKKQWVTGLAKALAEIHNINVDAFEWKYFSYNDIHSLGTPAWTSVPHIWEKALNIVGGTRPTYRKTFIHRDYHPTNVLWKDGSVSGVVDWVNACLGPTGIDLGHCRLNLALLYGVEMADAFLHAYQEIQGDSFTYEPYWDLVSVMDILFGPPTVYPGWEAFGVKGLTNQMMEERLDEYVRSLVEV